MWKTVRLGDVAEVKAGNSAPQDKTLFEAGTYPFVRTSDVGKIKIGVISDSTDRLNEKGIAKLNLFKKGTILFPKSGASTFLNHRVMLGFDAYISSHLATIKADEKKAIDSYVWYFLQKIDAADLVADSAYPSLQAKTIKEIDLPLPPLAEQQRIVAKLDAAFAEIDRAVELTAKRHINTSSLIAKAQNSLFEDMPLSVPRLNLSEVAKFENGDRGKNYPSKKHQISEGIPFVNAGDFSLDGDITSNGMAYISEERFNLLGAGKFKKDDVLFCLRGSLGKSAINKTLEQGAIASSLVLIRALQEHVQADYLFAFMRSDLVKTYISETAGGAAQPNLSAKVVMGYKIPVPSLEEQEFIADKFWGLRQCGLDAISLIEKKKSELMALKSAILAQELQPHERS